jgi:hypothetical protein
MINSFFLMSGWLFWVVVFLFIIAETAATEAESLGVAFTLFVVGLLVITLFSDANIGDVVLRHPILALCMIPAYFVLGIGWSFLKWRGVIVESAEKFEGEKASLLKKYGDRSDKGESFEQWLRLYRYAYPPSAAENKERITTWIAFWPFSLLWSCLTYPRRVAVYLYKQLVAKFQRMSEAAFADKFKA